MAISARPSKTWFWRRLRRLTRPYAGGTLLDLACADGKILEVIGKDTFRYVGGDINDALLVEARAAYPHQSFIHVDLLDDATYPQETFDVVLSSHTLGHIPSDAHAHIAGNLYLRLAPGGLLVIQASDLAEVERGLTALGGAVKLTSYRGSISRAFERALVEDRPLLTAGKGRIRKALALALSPLDGIGRKDHHFIVAHRPKQTES